jgi:hypothetical protein
VGRSMSDIAPIGILDEHAPRNQEGGAKSESEYQPTADERKAIKLVEKLFEKAKRHRSQYDQRWLDYYKMFRGNQWKEQRPSYRHAEVINLVFRTIQSLVPLQVDSRPKFEFLPQEPADRELVEILNEVAEADWVRHNWNAELYEIILDSNLYGTGQCETCHDPKADFNKGKIDFKSADPFYCFPDPDARDTNKGCEYFIYAEPVDVRKLRRDYPEKKDFIKPDVIDIMKGSKTDVKEMKFRSPVDNKVTLEGSNNIDLLNKDQALKITCWISPEYLHDEFEEHENILRDPETGVESSEFIQIAKYPRGRKIVVCNGVLLEDGPNPYDDGINPYDRLVNYVLPREYWGMSEIEQLEGPQKTFNKLVSFALDVLTLMGNPIWVNPLGSDVDSENLVNRPGLVVEPASREEAPYRIEGVQLQPYVLQMIEMMGTWFDSLGGSNDITRGVQPTGVTAARAISTLQEAAHTRIRQKTRNLDCMLQNVGQKYLSRVFQFYTAPEVFRLTAKDGSYKYFRFHVEKYDKQDELGQPTGEQGIRAYAQPYTDDGKIDPEQLRVFEMRGKIDVRVATGSNLPFARDEKEQKLLAYYDRQIIDAEEVLKNSEYSNWEAVLQRMEEKAARAAEAQQQQGIQPA